MNLLAALVDDAGLFPPASLPMAEALARHRADEAAGFPMLSHRFLCPASRIGELRTEWARLAGEDQAQLRLSVILDAGIGGLVDAQGEIDQDPLLVPEMFEVAVPASGVALAMDGLVGHRQAVFLEGPRRPDWIKTIAAADPGDGLRGAKVRCGGMRAELFPTPGGTGRLRLRLRRTRRAVQGDGGPARRRSPSG